MPKNPQKSAVLEKKQAVAPENFEFFRSVRLERGDFRFQTPSKYSERYQSPFSAITKLTLCTLEQIQLAADVSVALIALDREECLSRSFVFSFIK